MKGFKFRLQSVLEARIKKFEDSQIEFAKIKQRLNAENQKLNSLYKDLEQTTSSLELLINSGGIDYTFVTCHQNYIVKLKNDIQTQQMLIKKIEKLLEEKNKILLEALKDKTMMEKLRDKAQEEFRKNMERLDLINIDEIATQRYKGWLQPNY